MPVVSPSQAARMKKIQDWLEWEESRYHELISRATETASASGFDREHLVRPCECRLSWQLGRLCLVCDNTRLRQCSPGEEGFDPYELNVRAIRGGWTAQSANDESVAQKRAAAMAILEHQLWALIQAERQRAGKEAPLAAVERLADRMSHKPASLAKIHRARQRLQVTAPTLAHSLPRSPIALYVLSRVVPGRIDPPPAH